MQVTIQDFRTEFVATKGKQGYSKGTIVYTTGDGQQREQRIMSFANPSVFETLKNLKLPARVEVALTKNDKGYTEWAKVEPSTQEAPSTAVVKSGSVSKSTYETAEERAARQVLIVKQSCLAQAVAHIGKTENASVQDVLGVAQEFVDWVMGTGDADIFEQPNDI